MDTTGRRRSRLFTLRMWSEGVGEGTEHRGRVRAVESGAFRNFRDWSDLTAFLAEQLEDDRSTNEEET